MSDIFEFIPKLNVLNERNSPFVSNIKKMVEYCENLLKEIKHTFPNYTNHDIKHSFCVIKYMCDAVNDMNLLSELEMTALIYTGLLHDIGMVVSDGEKELIRSNKYILSNYDYQSVYESCNNDDEYAMQEIIRPIHAIRSKEHIMEKMPDYHYCFEIPGMNNVYFDEIVANICVAHNEEFEWIKLNLEDNIKLGKYSINPQYIAFLLRLADLLDVDSCRAPDYLYNLIAPKGISDEEWKKHFIITNSEKIIEENGIKYIEFYGSTEDAKIHRKILNYIDWIKKELENSTVYLNENALEKYNLNISPHIRNYIKPKNFQFSNFKLSLDYKSITNLLMGENIYNDKRCGLREIIQNSIDACKLMKEEIKKIPNHKYTKYTPQIIINIDKEQRKVSIYDNGIGMSFDIIKKYFLNVGVSYYNSNDCKYRGYEYTPIGNYGIGFLACFMLSNNIHIKTKRFDSEDTITVDIEKDNEYVVFNKTITSELSFTEISLDDTFFSVFNSIDQVKFYIETMFLNDDIEIYIQYLENGEEHSIKCDMIDLNTIENHECLSKYLKGIDLCVEMSNNVQYIKTLDDISECNYVYKDGKLIKYNSAIHNINDLVFENKLHCATITFIPSCEGDKLEYYIEALDDYTEAIERMEGLDKINIYYNDNLEIFSKDQEYFDINDENGSQLLFESGCTINELIQNIHTNDLNDTNILGIYCESYDYNLAGSGENMYIKFVQDRHSWRFHNRERTLYIRNVLISNFMIELPYRIVGPRISRMIANVHNKKVIPDISRSKINNNASRKINYAIGKAIHLWLYEQADLSDDKKRALKTFINLKYSRRNEFVADKYNEPIE
ncbi:MAG: ATP-binding protein [Clostridia bacterium]|nr:ATP-binding protein [Clostridia bacterium]